MCLLPCRLKLDSREPTGLVCHHHVPSATAPTDAYTGVPLSEVTSEVTEVEEQDRSLEIGGSYLSPLISCSASELWHSPARPSTQHLLGILMAS